MFTKTVMNISSALPPPQQAQTSPSTSNPPRAEYTCVLGTATAQRRIQTMKAREQLIKRISVSRRSEVLWRKRVMSKQRVEALNVRRGDLVICRRKWWMSDDGLLESVVLGLDTPNHFWWVSSAKEAIPLSSHRCGHRPPSAACPYMPHPTRKPKANTKTQQT